VLNISVEQCRGSRRGIPAYEGEPRRPSTQNFALFHQSHISPNTAALNGGAALSLAKSQRGSVMSLELYEYCQSSAGHSRSLRESSLDPPFCQDVSAVGGPSLPLPTWVV